MPTKHRREVYLPGVTGHGAGVRVYETRQARGLAAYRLRSGKVGGLAPRQPGVFVSIDEADDRPGQYALAYCIVDPQDGTLWLPPIND